MNVIPIAALRAVLVRSVAGLWRNEIRTDGSKIHDTGKSDDPEVHGIDNITTIELQGHRTLDSWAGEYRG